jgi:uncharacterized protein (DUF58 family)
VAAFALGFAVPFFLALGKILLLLLAVAVGAEAGLLLALRKGLAGGRKCPERFSNGDDNEVRIWLENRYRFPASIEIIDEAPVQFQLRHLSMRLQLPPGEARTLSYILRPTRRGEYAFGHVNAFATGPLGLLSRRFRLGAPSTVAVYPSFLQMRKYELMAISNRLTDIGVKRIRRIGHNMEFDQIREYVPGDDYRAINWKATARKNALMANQYQDERSQQVYCLIDKGRAMQMPFEGMALLDYAINASLVLASVAIRRQDKAGLITFNTKVKTHLPPSNRPAQLQAVMDALYREKTSFRESDFERMYTAVRHHARQRSLVMLFTNFETLSGFERQLKYLRGLARLHLLVVVFFENTELRQLREAPPADLEGIYIQTIAEKLAYEKQLIVKALQQYGIFPIFTSPQNLTVDAINKYLELKARGLM